MSYIPILTPVDTTLLVKYFSSIDRLISQRLAKGFSADEEHLTSLLCEMLDDRLSGLHPLAYTTKQLNEDLKKNNSLLNASFKLETVQYTKHQEAKITQSDIGIIVNYTDTIERDKSFRKGLLLQAKRLFPDNNTYSLNSKYQSFNHEQHERLHKLVESPNMGGGWRCAAYLLYNPPMSELPQHDREVILYREATHSHYARDEIRHLLRTREFSYFWIGNMEQSPLTLSLNVTDFGLLVVSVDAMHRIIPNAKLQTPKTVNLKLVLDEIRSFSTSLFAHYIVFELLSGNVGCENPDWLKIVSGKSPNQADDPLFPRPKYVITINITAGTAIG